MNCMNSLSIFLNTPAFRSKKSVLCYLQCIFLRKFTSQIFLTVTTEATEAQTL